MRATVIGVAVASLVALGRLSSQESAPRAATAGPPRAPQQTSDSVTARVAAVDDTIRFGGRTIEAGDSVRGPIVVAAGDLRVRGTVLGSAVAIAGDVIVEGGGRVTGDAIAILGTVRLEGGAGQVGGDQRSFAGRFASYLDVDRERIASRQSTRDAVSLALGWLVVILLIGIGVLVFANSYLEGATDVLEQSFWRSFLIGVAGELAILPALVLVLVALAITVVGILLIPFAVVAYVLAVTGLVTLGFLAMARLTGGSIASRRAGDLSARGHAVRGLVFGITLYLGMWVVAAMFQWSPIVSGTLRGLAMAITYVAATAGFGAAILSRGGTRRDAARRQPVEDEIAVWQTPTPVTGVVAARRPTPATPRQRA